ncbi:MAG: hypothetical protein ACOC3V_03420, partial [bacterium]
MPVAANISTIALENTFEEWVNQTNNVTSRANQNMINVGDLSELDTSEQSNVVYAINELHSEQFTVEYPDNNTIAGEDSGSVTDYTTTISGGNNTIYGANNSANLNVGANNVAIGSTNFVYNQAGLKNVSIGNEALRESISTNEAVAIGYGSQRLVIGAEYCTSVGSESLAENLNTDSLVAFGYKSLNKNSTGERNSGIGYQSLLNNQTGSDNTGGGYEALKDSTGDKNTGFGSSVLINNTGDNNTAIGYRAGYSSTGSRNVFIGSHAGYNDTTNNNVLYIHNDSNAAPLIFGDFSTAEMTVNGVLKSLNGSTTPYRVNRFLGANTSDPSNPQEGDTYYNTVSSAVKLYADGGWVVIDTSEGTFNEWLGISTDTTGSGLSTGANAGSTTWWKPSDDDFPIGFSIFDGTDWHNLPINYDLGNSNLCMGRKAGGDVSITTYNTIIGD